MRECRDVPWTGFAPLTFQTNDDEVAFTHFHPDLQVYVEPSEEQMRLNPKQLLDDAFVLMLQEYKPVWYSKNAYDLYVEVVGCRCGLVVASPC